MAKSPRINFVLPFELRKRIDAVSKETGMPLSMVIRKALEGYLTFCEEKILKGEGFTNVTADSRGRYWK